MTTTFTPQQTSRADLLLIALAGLQRRGDHAPTRPRLERLLARLAQDDALGAFFREYYRGALLHRAVMETLAYLEQNRLLAPSLQMTPEAYDRIKNLDAMSPEIDRVIKVSAAGE